MLFAGQAIVPLLLAGILVVGLLVLIGWAVFMSFQKGASVWRVVFWSLFMTVITVLVFVGWWFVGIVSRIGGLVPFNSPWANLLWLGFLVIPIAGFVSTVWVVGRLEQNPNRASD